jgi:hypothetical protein
MICLLLLAFVPAAAITLGTAPCWAPYLESVALAYETAGKRAAVMVALKPVADGVMNACLRLEPLGPVDSAVAICAIPLVWGAAIAINSLP